MNAAMGIVRGVLIAKVDKAVLKSSLKALGLEASGTKGMIEALVGAYEGQDNIKCENCKGKSPRELQSCPFCGDLDQEEAEEKKEDEEDVKVARERMGGETIPWEKVKKNLDITSPEEVLGEIIATAVPVSAPMTSEQAAQVLGSDERQLDDAVVRINEAKDRCASEWYQLGREILEVYKLQLWKMRKDENGRPKYKTWSEFVDAELEMGRSHVYGRMNVVEKYTLEQVQMIGRRNCELLLSAPEEKQAELVEAAVRGESVRQIQAKVREAKKSQPRKGGPKPKLEVAKDSKDELTLATIIGYKHQLPMFKPGKGEEGEKLAPAKKLDDQPWTYLDLKNGVRLVFRLQKFPSGQLKLVMDAKREE